MSNIILKNKDGVNVSYQGVRVFIRDAQSNFIEFVHPEGVLTITEGGEYNVADKEKVIVALNKYKGAVEVK